MPCRGLLLLLLLLAGLLNLNQMILAADAPTAAQLDFFEKKIRPVLVQHCYECHSAEAAKQGKLKAGLQLDNRDGFRAGGESGPSFVPGEKKAGLLIKALRHEDLEMPPDQKLPEAVIKDFEEWIASGAADPRDGKPVVVRPMIDIAAARQFWSFQPLKNGTPPPVKQADWPLNAIDQFVLAKLEAQQLAPVEDADAVMLLRRLHFDLIGLPPLPQDVERFTQAMKTDRRAAIETEVDRLLASPHFGERWGRHWLDVARWSESSGGTRNMLWFHAWRYRDYVIDAFNADKPINQFIKENIAGDLLPSASPEQRDQQTVATGFLALGQRTLDEQKVEVFRMDGIDEQIDVIGRVFLGLSVSCARCHDHKFDPISTRDYYALAGIFRSTQPLYGHGPKGIKGQHDSDLSAIGADAERLAPAAREHLQKVKELTQKRNDGRSTRYRFVRNVDDLKNRIKKPGADVAAMEQDIAKNEATVREWDEKLKGIDQELADAVARIPPQPAWAMSARERPAAEDCRIHIRGETTNLGDTVPRGLLQIIQVSGLPPIEPQQSGRLQLVEWLTSSSNPLPPRVFVNRIWQQLFARGLVATPDDFGINGAKPSHPELLDHLAAEFVADGWSLKRLIRRCVLSRSYQLSSSGSSTAAKQVREVDPDNVLLARRRPRRLDAEALRDSALSVSGLLEPKPYPGTKLSEFNPFQREELFGFDPFFKPETAEHRYRSVYLPIVRGVLPEALKLFDFADPSRPVAQRDESTVPAQSLYLMNSPWVIDVSQALARRIMAVSDQDDARLQHLFALAFSHPIAADEQARLKDFLTLPAEQLPTTASKPADPASEQLARWTSLCQAILTSSEFRHLP